MRKIKLISTILLLFVLLSCACSCVAQNNKENTTNGISVIATLFPQYDFARAILGEKGNAVLLLSPGADSHNFELTPTDIRKINNSDIFVYTGPDMEVWVDSIINSINAKVKVVNLSEGLTLKETDHGHDHGAMDPHLWTNPVYAKEMLKAICNSICQTDPENKDYYEANYLSYSQELEAIDTEIKDIASNANNNCLYFSGKFAFYHFVEEYGFTYAAPFNSCSDVQIESPAAINNLIESIKNSNTKYVFYEELSNNSILETIVAQTNVTPLLLHSTHNVSKEEYENGVTYASLMKNNVLNLRKALIDG